MTTTTSPQLEQVVDVFRRWLHMPDERALLAAAGSIAANRMTGDPVWLLIVGPPGGGKSELVNAFSKLDHIHPAATLTEASLLSGTPKRERDEASRGGLLRVIGDFGILLLKDFTSILSMHRDERGRVISALREVYDGSWTRHVGVDGGRTLHWTGRVGLLGGVTPTIDRHHAVMGAMGERFVLFRLPTVDEDEQARRSIAHAGKETQMRAELAEAINGLLGGDLPAPQPRTQDEIDQLVSLAGLVVRARSAIERDSYSREIELISEAEAPTRIIVVLSRMLDGLDAIGCDPITSWSVVTKLALDSMPQLRRSLLELLLHEETPTETSVLAELLKYPTGTTRRALEDLHAHRLIDRIIQGKGKADLWQLTPWTRGRYENLALDRTRFVSTESDHLHGKVEEQSVYSSSDFPGKVSGHSLNGQVDEDVDPGQWDLT